MLVSSPECVKTGDWGPQHQGLVKGEDVIVNWVAGMVSNILNSGSFRHSWEQSDTVFSFCYEFMVNSPRRFSLWCGTVAIYVLVDRQAASFEHCLFVIIDIQAASFVKLHKARRFHKARRWD